MKLSVIADFRRFELFRLRRWGKSFVAPRHRVEKEKRRIFL